MNEPSENPSPVSAQTLANLTTLATPFLNALRGKVNVLTLKTALRAAVQALAITDQVKPFEELQYAVQCVWIDCWLRSLAARAPALHRVSFCASWPNAGTPTPDLVLEECVLQNAQGAAVKIKTYTVDEFFTRRGAALPRLAELNAVLGLQLAQPSQVGAFLEELHYLLCCHLRLYREYEFTLPQLSAAERAAVHIDPELWRR